MSSDLRPAPCPVALSPAQRRFQTGVGHLAAHPIASPLGAAPTSPGAFPSPNRTPRPAPSARRHTEAVSPRLMCGTWVFQVLAAGSGGPDSSSHGSLPRNAQVRRSGSLSSTVFPVRVGLEQGFLSRRSARPRRTNLSIDRRASAPGREPWIGGLGRGAAIAFPVARRERALMPWKSEGLP